VPLRHRLESVRMLPPHPRQNDPRLYGLITASSAYAIEIVKPDRPRVFCMAVTAPGRTDGVPSSWSAEIDQLAAGVEGEDDEGRRLFFVSAGNIALADQSGYPDVNDTQQVEDPGHSWNAVTVGACTDLVQFRQAQYPGWRPVAAAGDLRTSFAVYAT